MATRTESQQTITKITLRIPKSYKQVIARLESSLIQPSARNTLAPDALTSRAAFESATNASLGPHGFMKFFQISHGAWMGLYGVHVDKQATRIIFGNPLIAITMLRHDVNAGLFVPVEALVVERGESETEVVYVKPSTLIVGDGKDSHGSEAKALQDAAEALDAKMEALWDWVAGDEEL